MTWLQGTTTWGSVVGKLTQLACGEVADDTATTVAGGDAWVRIAGGVDTIRTPNSTAVSTGSVNFRAGYFSLLSMNESTNPDTYSFQKSICKQTSAWTGVPTGVTSWGANNRWCLTVVVGCIVSNQTQGNNVSGNYSTASLRWSINNIDDGVNVANGSVTPSSSGDCSITVGTKTLTFNVSDASGFLTVGTAWSRVFTGTYLGGIDYHGPFFRRRTAAASYSVNPPGTSGTDFDLEVDIPSVNSSSATIQAQPQTSFGSTATNWANLDAGGIGCGVGWKTAGPGGNYNSWAQYTCSWNMWQWSMRLIALSASFNGGIAVEMNRLPVNDGGSYRFMGCGATIGNVTAGQGWLQPFTVPGSVDPTSQVQYWMSVKADRMVIILNGDPGASGVLTDAAVWTFTPFDFLGATPGTYDQFPIMCSSTVQQSGSNTGVQSPMSYLHQVIRQDTSTASLPSGRDWQTRWGRADGTVITPTAPTTSNMFPNFTDTNQGFLYTGNSFISVHLPGTQWYSNSFTGVTDLAVPLTSSKPNPFTGKWRLYGFACVDVCESATGAAGGLRDWDYPRGYMPANTTSPFLIIPGGLWASGDEITDTISGKKWFLVSHSVGAPGIFGFSQNGIGVAVLES